MGEAKRRKSGTPPRSGPDLATGFNTAERERLGHLRLGAYRHAVAALNRAMSASQADAQRTEILAIHREAVRALDNTTDSFLRDSQEGPGIAARIACRKGCSFCCYVNVEATIVEVVAVAAAAAADPRLRESVLATAPRLRGLDALARIKAHVACPLLHDGTCTVYSERPRTCRAFTSYDAKRCEEELREPEVERPKVRSFTWPRMLASAITDGIQTACQEQGLQACTVELTAGVAAVLEDEALVARWLRGESPFTPYQKVARV